MISPCWLPTLTPNSASCCSWPAPATEKPPVSGMVSPMKKGAGQRARRQQALLCLGLLSLILPAGAGGCGRTKQQKQGAELYGRMCAVCHGAGGEGYKADQ